MADKDKFDTIKLINEIEKRPSLWNSNLAEYVDKQHRQTAWEEILDVFDGNTLDATERRELAIGLQKRWKNIRSCYSREIKRQNGGRIAHTRKTEYKHTKQLQFLQGFVATIKDCKYDSDSDSYTSKGKKSRLQKNREDSSSEETEDNDDHNENPQNEIEVAEQENYFVGVGVNNPPEQRETADVWDEDSMFLLSLVNTLKDVPRERKMATKIKIMSVLQEATQDCYVNQDLY